MNPATVLLIVLGAIFGPVYLAYCEYLSGETAETRTLTERADRWELSDGSILRLRGGRGYRPVALELTPDLNLYRFRFTFDVARGRASPKEPGNEYQVSVLQGDVGIYERSVGVAGDGAVSVALDPMEILYSGSYVLLLEEVGAPRLQVARVKLEVRNRVEKKRTWLVWCGLVMLLVGAAIMVRDLMVQTLKK